MTPPRHRLAVAAAGSLAALALTAGCGGADDAGASVCTKLGASPDALAAAKKAFDEAPSVHFTMATDSKPSGNAVLGASGTLTHQPAFEGEVKVNLMGAAITAPIIAVDGTVYAKLLTPAYDEIDPADYSAPDPADFADPDSGISGLLTRIGDPSDCKAERDGKDVVGIITGSLPGEIVAPIIPSAAAEGTYAVEVGIDADGFMKVLHVTGAFFSDDDDVTYDLAFDSYDEDVTISAP